MFQVDKHCCLLLRNVVMLLCNVILPREIELFSRTLYYADIIKLNSRFFL